MAGAAKVFRSYEFGKVDGQDRKVIQFWTGYTNEEARNKMRTRDINPKALKLDDFTKVHWV
jgi:hypothetical protein